MPRKETSKKPEPATADAKKTASAFSSIQDTFKNPKAARRALVLSEDQIRRNRAEDALAQAAIGTGKLKPEIINCAELKKNDLEAKLVDAQNVSLFSPTRLLIFRAADELDATMNKTLLSFLEDQPQHLAIILSGKSLAQNSTTRKFFANIERLAELPALDGASLTRWTAKELAQAGLTEVETSAISLIIDLAESRPDAIAPLVNQLALFCEGSRATRADVEALFGTSLTLDEFKLVELISAGRQADAQLLLTRMLRRGGNAFALLGLMYRSYSQYFQLQSLGGSSRSPFDLANATRIPFWLVKKIMPSAERYSRRRLVQCFESFLSADSKLKNRSLGADEVISEFVSAIAS